MDIDLPATDVYVHCNDSQVQDASSNSTLCPPGENFTCYDLEEVPNGALVVHTIFLALIGVLSLLANGLVLFLVAKYKRLRSNHSVVLALLLVTSDLLLTFTYILPTFTTTIFKEWKFGKGGCVAFGFLASDILLTRWMIISLFCMDRFFNVKFPFKYKGKRRKVVLIVLSVAAWLLPAAATVVPIHLFAEFDLRPNIPTCLPECNSSNRHSELCKLYYAVTSCISFFMGSILPTIIYSWLYCKGKSARTSVRNSIGQITLQVTGGVITKPYIDHRIITDRERRATITFLLVFITVLVTAAPSFLSQAIRAASIRFHCSLPIYVHFVIHHILLSAFVLNPIFIMRDPDFKYCLRQVFCCGRTNVGSNSFNSRPLDQIQEGPTTPTNVKTDSLMDNSYPNHQEITLNHLEVSSKADEALDNMGSSDETASYTSV